MNSIARFTYPRMVWRNGERQLWNPIHRKPLKNRPEERVRLRTVEYLLAAGWSRNRISTEEPVGTFAESDLRTDIICYDRNFQRKLLVECKAEHINITAQTAEQVARYNQMVEAPYLMMTNGLTDYWYSIEGNGVKELSEAPAFLPADFDTLDYSFENWQQYGFAGGEASVPLQEWLEPLLNQLWSGQKDAPVFYLKFNSQPTEFPFSNYYHLKDLSDTRRLALTTMDTPRGESRMIAVLNEEQVNTAVLEIDLDRLFDGQAENATLYSASGPSELNISDHISIKETDQLHLLYKHVAALFNNANIAQ